MILDKSATTLIFVSKPIFLLMSNFEFFSSSSKLLSLSSGMIRSPSIPSMSFKVEVSAFSFSRGTKTYFIDASLFRFPTKSPLLSTTLKVLELSFALKRNVINAAKAIISTGARRVRMTNDFFFTWVRYSLLVIKNIFFMNRFSG